jgi:hypothetical protein
MGNKSSTIARWLECDVVKEEEKSESVQEDP